jgi:rRNA maturation endonuclease Nob1
MTECFWCSEVYDSTDHDTCPSCAVDTHTKGVKIVVVESAESE